MSKDSILGWTLILLVVISLFLSFTIWSRVPGHLSVARMIQSEKKVDPTLVVSPEKILIYLGNSFNTMLKTSSPLYDKTWNLSRKLLASQWTISSEPMENINREYFESFSYTTTGSISKTAFKYKCVGYIPFGREAYLFHFTD